MSHVQETSVSRYGDHLRRMQRAEMRQIQEKKKKGIKEDAAAEDGVEDEDAPQGEVASGRPDPGHTSDRTTDVKDASRTSGS